MAAKSDEGTTEGLLKHLNWQRGDKVIVRQMRDGGDVGSSKGRAGRVRNNIDRKKQRESEI